MHVHTCVYVRVHMQPCNLTEKQFNPMDFKSVHLSKESQLQQNRYKMPLTVATTPECCDGIFQDLQISCFNNFIIEKKLLHQISLEGDFNPF